MNDRDNNVYALARLGIPAGPLDTILRLLPAVQRAHEAACMAWPEEMVAAFAKRGDAAFRKIRELLSHSNAPCFRQTDPRGCTVEVYDVGRKPDGAEPRFRLGAPGFTASEMRRLDKAAEYRAAKSL